MEECQARQWDEIDIILVSGDAYVDHPSFGIALIGRLLEAEGYRVAILAQPRCDSEADFLRFGRPRLFWGISGGNLDSIVANYSGNGKVRDFDAYSPNGSPWRTEVRERSNRYRPDRAVLVYANLARKAYPDSPIVLGGVESSLRRFVHFDYKQNRLRTSHLTDAKGDLLVYGMAERAIVQTAHLLDADEPLTGMPGTCIRLTDAEMNAFRQHCSETQKSLTVLPSWEEIQRDPARFMKAERIIDRHARAGSSRLLAQRQQANWVVQHPSAKILSTEEMDRLYTLPFSRVPHPSTPEVPAYQMIKNSVTVVRGCYGNCSFCAITRHQGPRVTSRSAKSVATEVTTIAALPGFDGTITDLGGPTANLYGTTCAIGGCPKHDCLYPEICKNLIVNEQLFLDLLNKVSELDSVSHLFISSGLRLELLVRTPRLLDKLVRDHTPGNLKIAPEHTEDEVLTLMHKEPHQLLIGFVTLFKEIARKYKKRVGLTPYVISAHPGCTEDHTRSLVRKMKRLGLSVRQFQDFTPTPGTISTAMYVSGRHRDKNISIPVARNQAERNRQRRIIEQGFMPRSAKSPQRNSPKRRSRKIRK